MDDDGRRLAVTIEARLAAYLPDEPPERLRLIPLGSQIRATTRLDMFAVEGPAERTQLLAKTYLPPAGPGTSDPADPVHPVRPRLAPLTPPSSRADLEFRALSAVATGIGSAEPDHLAAVPIHDLIDGRTIVMGRLPWPSLDRILARRRLLGRFAGPPSEPAVGEAFRNAGRWLARFRALPLPTDGARLASRGEVIAALAELGGHLHDTTGAPTPADLERASAAATAILPATLPTAPGHGDFAMRNVLVDPLGRVAVLDTRARWSVPAEEDLATLLVALRTNRLQAVTGGRAWRGARLAVYENALLDGFGNEPGIRARLRAFELLVLWDKWAADRVRAAGRARVAGGAAGRARAGNPIDPRARLLDAAAERHYRRSTAAILRAIERP